MTTVALYAKEAFKAISNMIPECLFLYGKEAGEKWFTNRGLEAYKTITWCPKKKTTSSTSDKLSKTLVDEDFFGLGMEWNKNNTDLNEIKRSENNQVATVLSERANDLEVHSFGSVYGRSHDGESIATTKPKENVRKTTISFDPETIEKNSDKAKSKEDMSLGMSSAGFTTDSVRVRLKDEKELNKKLLEENRILMERLQKNDDQSVVSTNTATTNKSARSTKTTVSTTQRLAAALKELTVLKANKEIQATATINVPITPLAPTNIEQTGTEVDGAGKNI